MKETENGINTDKTVSKVIIYYKLNYIILNAERMTNSPQMIIYIVTIEWQFHQCPALYNKGWGRFKGQVRYFLTAGPYIRLLIGQACEFDQTKAWNGGQPIKNTS